MLSAGVVLLIAGLYLAARDRTADLSRRHSGQGRSVRDPASAGTGQRVDDAACRARSRSRSPRRRAIACRARRDTRAPASGSRCPPACWSCLRARSCPSSQGTVALTGDQWTRPVSSTGGAQPLVVYSLLLRHLLGTMGLPHILVRFYTNPDGRAARPVRRSGSRPAQPFLRVPVLLRPAWPSARSGPLHDGRHGLGRAAIRQRSGPASPARSSQRSSRQGRSPPSPRPRRVCWCRSAGRSRTI